MAHRSVLNTIVIDVDGSDDEPLCVMVDHASNAANSHVWQP